MYPPTSAILITFPDLSDTVKANLGRVIYRLRTSRKTLLSALYNGKSPGKNPKDQGAIDLIMFSVPLGEREEARNLIAREILPLLETWIEALARSTPFPR